MRLKCYIQGGCKFKAIHREFLPPDKAHQMTRFHKIEECEWCGDLRVQIASAEPAEARNTLPRRWLDNGVEDRKPA